MVRSAGWAHSVSDAWRCSWPTSTSSSPGWVPLRRRWAASPVDSLPTAAGGGRVAAARARPAFPPVRATSTGDMRLEGIVELVLIRRRSRHARGRDPRRRGGPVRAVAGDPPTAAANTDGENPGSCPAYLVHGETPPRGTHRGSPPRWLPASPRALHGEVAADRCTYPAVVSGLFAEQVDRSRTTPGRDPLNQGGPASPRR
jgi:hypothetical protein